MITRRLHTAEDIEAAFQKGHKVIFIGKENASETGRFRRSTVPDFGVFHYESVISEDNMITTEVPSTCPNCGKETQHNTEYGIEYINCGSCKWHLAMYKEGEVSHVVKGAVDLKEPIQVIAHEQAATGAKRSSMYPPGTKFPARYDLMFRNAAGMRRLAETWGEGFAKYGADNWMKGFPASVFISHALEHVRLYLAGDSSEDHLAHGAWNLLALCWVEENKPELLDLTMPVQVCFQAGQGDETTQ